MVLYFLGHHANQYKPVNVKTVREVESEERLPGFPYNVQTATHNLQTVLQTTVAG